MRSPYRYTDEQARIHGVNEHRHILVHAFPRSWSVDPSFWDDMTGVTVFEPSKSQGTKKSLTVIHGRDDMVCPLSMGERCARDLDGRLVVVDGGHGSAMSTEQVIEWLLENVTSG